MMRHIARIFVCAIMTLLVACATDPSIGYSTVAVYPEHINTVAVPIFTNDTFVRDVEFDLTDAVQKEILRRTPYRLAAESRADSVLLGHIRRVELDQLSKSRTTGLAEEVILSVTIDFAWSDLRTGTTLVERRDFTAGKLFVPSAPTGESIEIGQFAVAQQLATDIVDEMRASW